MNIYEYTGKKIKTLRKERNLTRKDLAQITCLPNNYLKKVELGKAKLKLTTLCKIALLLDTTAKNMFQEYKN